MPSISALYPRRYLAVADIKNLPSVLKISCVKVEEVGQDQKPVLYFIGHEKGLVLNKTNAKALAAIYGDETDDWTGKPVRLFEMVVDFRGTATPTVRVSIGL